MQTRYEMVFFIPGTDAKIFQGARRVFTFHIEIFSLLSELANSVMKRSKCEKWKLFKPLEKFKRKGLGWVICFLRLIEVYLYAIIISTYQEKLTQLCKNLYRMSTDIEISHFLDAMNLLILVFEGKNNIWGDLNFPTFMMILATVATTQQMQFES